jgi:ubiquinone/menaquinone biosynthesis C-methylase UbiE
VDKKTLEFYDQNAIEISKLHNSLAPQRLYELANKFFELDAATLDLGCGIGRDTAWLCANDFPAIGVDNSEGMLSIANSQFPNLNFQKAELPQLDSLKDSTYYNIFCSAVIHHVPEKMLEVAIANIVRVTAPGGKILLSYRGTNALDNRESGKLYENYQLADLMKIFSSLKARTFYTESSFDEKRKIKWLTLILEKSEN